MIAAVLIFLWVAPLAYVALEAWRAPVVPNEAEQDPFEEVDAVVFEFPQHRVGGGWRA